MDMALHLDDGVIQFTVLVTAALAMQLMAERARLPGLLGLLVVGAVLGPGGFEVLRLDPVVSLLGEIGLIYVMFIAGMEIDLGVAGEHRREVIGFGLIAFLITGPAGFAAGLFLGLDVRAAALFGVIIASHTLVSYPILLRLGLLQRLSVITAVGGTLVTDALSLILLAVVMASARAGSATGVLLPLALLTLLAIGSLLLVPRLADATFGTERMSQAEKALFALVVLMVLASLSDALGTEHILGAFLAGICLNRALARHKPLREHLEFVGRMLFVPFFLVWTGALLDVDALTGEPRVWLIAGVLAGVLVAGKAVAAWIAGARFNYPVRDRLLTFGLTLPQAAATLAITMTAREAGLFDETVLDAVIIVIFASCLAGVLITQFAGGRMRAHEVQEGAGEPVHAPSGGDR
jgi:Kef-type K+ transport system membrane component KefB